MAGAKKPRLLLHQMIFFSVGNVLNDLCNTIFTSYLLIFQTRVLDLPNDIVGLLWLIPAAVDSTLALLIGYASDNAQIPYMSRFYGRRKSWHLLGCTLVGISCPFILMPCFICSGNFAGNWMIVLYYSTIIVITYAGWNLSQANFLALIPVIAKRQSEMVKLGALNSAITLICGIFVYMVTWLLLGSDSSDTISFSQWKKFMYLVVIVVGTGAFFTAIYHCGTREPAKDLMEESKQTSHCKKADNAHEFSKKEHGNIVNGQVAIHAATRAHEVSEVIQGAKHTVLVNPSFENDEDDLKITGTKDAKHKQMTALDVSELEAVLWDRLSKKSDEQTDDSASDYSGYGDANTVDTSSEEGSDCEIVELPMPGTFIDMVPHVSEVILHSHRSSTRSSPVPSPRLSRAASRRSRASTLLQNDSLYNSVLRSKLNSTSSRASPMGTPRLCRSSSNRLISPFELPNLHSDTNSTHTAFSIKIPPTINTPATLSDTKLHKYEQGHEDDCTAEKEHHILSTIEENFSKNEGIEVEIIDRSVSQNNDARPKNSWRTLFKKAEVYKLGGAYMFTRVCQNVTTSYLPLFLTDHLNFGKESIAYFPLVILVSGVFASAAAKKFNKKLGNKWTFCLGSIMVMGASGWFYLLTPDNRSVMYVPAILSGCGTSIMFVTTLALAADFVNADRSSGAFLIAAMTLLCKIVSGCLFWFLQSYAPKASGSSCPECVMYVHHVFSFTPGVSAFLGLISFILFIPATIQCKPITHTTDAETQTIEITDEEPPRHTNHLEAIIENDKEVSLVRILVDAETQTDYIKQQDASSSASEVDSTISHEVTDDDNIGTIITRL